MKVYLVGGAVRDGLLGIANHDTEKDWVVVGSSINEMLRLGYQQVGKAFPVFLHPKTKEEYALARREHKVGVGYQGFKFDTSSKVTLQEDLSRRDLSINAIAKDDNQLIDPFNGQKDLNSKILRHVSSAFNEDPVRVLRVARFAAKFQPLGFKVARQTQTLMKQMVNLGELDALTSERIFKELEKTLSYKTISAFFQVLFDCGAYQKIFPGLKHKHSQFEFLDQLNTDKIQVKFAIWLINEKLNDIKSLCCFIKCSKKHQQLAVLSNQFYYLAQIFLTSSSEEILNFFKKTDAFRRNNRFTDLLTVFKLLSVDISPILELQELLKKILISELDKNDIAKAIQQEKITIIESFLNSAK